MFRRLLIANRGEIACRIARTARRLGITTIALHAGPDADAPHVQACDEAVAIGGRTPAESYLRIDAVLEAARASRAEAVHPGYGFLSESAAFAERVAAAGLVFVGPGADAIAAMGDKGRAKARMRAAGVPVLPGYEGEDQSEAAFLAAAAGIGWPLMVKAAAGGGGRGMRLVDGAAGLPAALASARAEALAAFGDGRLILERAIAAPRHIEVQVLGDAQGRLLHLGERDCSVQRRHQKLVEEAPAPGLSAAQREALASAALAAAREVGYVNAGTVEFLFDGTQAYFMEMNTRLQVEHPVTEAITGIDLVEWQLRIAAGEALPWTQADIRFSGHAIEARVCAEDARADFLPQAGRIEHWRAPSTLRVDHALREGLALAPWYDSMLGKWIAHGATREEARRRLLHGLERTELHGLATNRDFLARVLAHPAFAAGEVHTHFIDGHFPDADHRAPPPDEAAWSAAAWASVQPPRTLGADWHHFNPTGFARWPVRLAWHGQERRGTLTVARDAAPVIEWTHPARPPEPPRVEGLRTHRAGTMVTVQGATGEWRFEDRRHAAAGSQAGRAGDGRIRAPFNGRIARVAVAPGMPVRRGDVLVTLEAMKMEHQLTASVDGRVASVYARVDEQASPGTLLVELELEESAA